MSLTFCLAEISRFFGAIRAQAPLPGQMRQSRVNLGVESEQIVGNDLTSIFLLISVL